jgi:uncharacterized protein YjbI with pentapeptide repeats
MANPEHLEQFKQGVQKWNQWRREHPDLRHPDLSQIELACADLRDADLHGANLWRAELRQSDFRGANLERADLMRAKLAGSDFRGATLSTTDLGWADLTCARFDATRLTDVVFTYADLEGASLRDAVITDAHMIYTKLRRADLSGATIKDGLFHAVNFEEANLEGAKLSGTDLSLSILVKANLKGTTLMDCRVFGVSAWGASLEGAVQKGLIVTDKEEANVTVEDIEVAQFVYLMLHNPNLRRVIDTIGRKAVLILGRFTPERKAVLLCLKDGLTRLGYVPILFDFERPADRNFTETIVTLAGMSLFVIADITNPSSSPLELQAVVPVFGIPVVPIIQEGEKPFSMFKDLQNSFGDEKEGRLLDLLEYPSAEVLVGALEKQIVQPAVDKSNVLSRKKATPLRIRKAGEMPGSSGQ